MPESSNSSTQGSSQPLAARGRPINDLPSELLGYIFEIGTREDEDPDSDMLSDGWETEEEGENALKNAGEDTLMVDADIQEKTLGEEPRRPFQVTVSHVCHLWREVALSTPALWTRINLLPPFDLNAVYLQRSAGAPLDITLDTDIENAEDDEDDDDSNGDEPQQMTIDQFTYALNLILPHAQRWRTLEIMVSNYLYMHRALGELSVLPGAPLLEVLQLYHHEDADEDEDAFTPSHLREPFFLPFSGNLPKLGGLALWGVHIDWAGAVPFFRNLVDLELAWHHDDVRPTFRQFAQLLREASCLQTLTICCSGPDGHVRSDWLESFNKEEISAAAVEGDGEHSVLAIALPELQSLSVSYLSVDYARDLIQLLTAPKLSKMMIDLEHEDFSVFAKTLIGTALLDHVDDLKLRSLPCDVVCVVALLRRLKGLHKLSLNFHYCDPTWFHLLTNVPGTTQPLECEDTEFRMPSPPPRVWTTASAAVQGDTAEGSAFLPHLEVFSASALSGTQIRWFVERRIALGAPLKAVWLDNDEDVSVEDEKWLRSNLETFAYYEDEDDEDDEDGDDMILEVISDSDDDGGGEDDDDDDD